MFFARLLVEAFIAFTLILPVLTAPAHQTRSEKPIIALVPGAWHSPVHYANLIADLEGAGYTVVTKRNPSCDSSNPNAQSVTTDANSIRNELLLPHINAGKDVVLAAHSYGGSPGCAAAKGLSQAERSAAGKKGGIIGLILICAFIAKEGDSLVSQLPGQKFDPWVIDYTGTGQLGVSGAKQVLYADVPSPIDQYAIAAIRNQSKNALSTPSGPPAWSDSYYNGRRSYFHTLLDHGIPPIAQDIMIANSGVQWNVKSFNSSHSPFLSHPQDLSRWMVQQAMSFQGAGTSES